MLTAETRKMIITRLAKELDIVHDKKNIKVEELLALVAVFAADVITSINQQFGIELPILEMSLYDIIVSLIQLQYSESSLPSQHMAISELTKVLNKYVYLSNVNDKTAYTMLLLQALVTQSLQSITDSSFANLIEDFCRELQRSVIPETRTLH